MAEGESLVSGIKYVLPVALALLLLFIVTSDRLLIGAALLALAIIPVVIFKLRGGDVEKIIADIVYGIFDVGGTVALASAGALVGGVWGAVFGTIIGDALLNSFAGVMEGKVAVWLRERGIEEARSPMLTGMGKMCGGFLAAGFVLIVVFVNLGV